MKKYSKQIVVFIVFSIVFVSSLLAQPAQTLIEVSVAPEKSDWLYKPNEKVKFNVAVTKNNIPVQNALVWYEVGPEMMPPAKKENLVLKNGTVTIDGGTMKEAGFLRCRVVATYEGKDYVGLATALSIRNKFSRQRMNRRILSVFGMKQKSQMQKYPWMRRCNCCPNVARKR